MALSARALVTGASRGIGFATARSLRLRGYEVVMVARGKDALQRAASEIGGIPVVADVAADGAIDGIVAEAGNPDVLVNAAGAFALAPVVKTDPAAFDAMLAANLRAPFLLIRALLPAMLQRRSGHIVSIGSVAGRQAFPGNGAYSASKYGLRGLHEVLEQELRGSGVRITLIEPAATDTPLWDAVDYAQNPGLPARSQMLSADAVAAAVMFALDQPAEAGIKYLGIERS